MESWPAEAVLHEVLSLRKWFVAHSASPSMVVAHEIEGNFVRPMMRIVPVTNRVQNIGRYTFRVLRACTITFFGSTLETGVDVYAEAYNAADWMARAFGRAGGYEGPLMQIYDFSQLPETPTDSWIFFDLSSTVVNVRQDEYGLWMVPADVSYYVEHSVATNVPTATPVPPSAPPPGTPSGPPPGTPPPSPGLITIKRKVHI